MTKTDERSKVRFSYLLGIFLAWTTVCRGQERAELTGQVKNSGNPSQRKTSIITRLGESPVQLWEGGKRYAIAQLAGSVLHIKGSFVVSSKDQLKCLLAESYSIREIAPGRPAIVGDLKLIEKNSYAVVGKDGKSWRLSRLAPGLKNLVGSTVVSDLIADSASQNETRWLVVRMFSKPD